MTYSGRPSTPPPTMRQLRPNPLVWSVVFLIFAGPFNPAAWLAWVIVDGTMSRDDLNMLAWTVLFPSTVVALIVLGAIVRRKVFSKSNLWRSALTGLFWGILAGPLGVILGNLRDFNSPTEIFNAYFGFLMLGTIFLIIPFFAIVFGLPSMLATVTVGYLCTEPVDRCTEPVDRGQKEPL